MRKASASLLFVALLALSAGAAARGPQSDTKRRMPSATVDALNRSLASVFGDTYGKPPVLLEAYEPYYPAKELRKSRNGVCQVEFTIAADGTVASQHVVSGDAPMCAHAQVALKYWKFRPAMSAGAAVPATVQLPFQFEVR